MNEDIGNISFLTLAPDNRWLLWSQPLQIEFYFYKQVAPLEHIYQKMCSNGSSGPERGANQFTKT
jgi:hypothetical protein